MKNKKVKLLTLSAMLAALTCVATLMIQIPTPTKGYVNLGDCIVNVSAWILPPFYSAAAAGLGSALADIITGYSVYAPATLVIKAGMAFASYFTFKSLSSRTKDLTARILAAAAAELIMAFGYTMYEVILYGSWSYAVIGTAGNIAQGVMGAVSSVALYELVLKKLPKLN